MRSTLAFALISLGVAVGCGAEGVPSDASTNEEIHDLDSAATRADSLGDASAPSDAHDARYNDGDDPDGESLDDGVSADTDDGASEVYGALVTANDWSTVPAKEDPWWVGAPVGVTPCVGDAVKVESQDDEQWYEVVTTYCNYHTAKQASKLPLSPGDTLLIRVYHFKILNGDGKFELSLAVGPSAEEKLWTKQLQLPANGALWASELSVKGSWPQGTPVFWHVRNHGINSWNLIEVSRVPGGRP